MSQPGGVGHGQNRPEVSAMSLPGGVGHGYWGPWCHPPKEIREYVNNEDQKQAESWEQLHNRIISEFRANGLSEAEAESKAKEHVHQEKKKWWDDMFTKVMKNEHFDALMKRDRSFPSGGTGHGFLGKWTNPPKPYRDYIKGPEAKQDQIWDAEGKRIYDKHKAKNWTEEEVRKKVHRALGDQKRKWWAGMLQDIIANESQIKAVHKQRHREFDDDMQAQSAPDSSNVGSSNTNPQIGATNNTRIPSRTNAAGMTSRHVSGVDDMQAQSAPDSSNVGSSNTNPQIGATNNTRIPARTNAAGMTSRHVSSVPTGPKNPNAPRLQPYPHTAPKYMPNTEISKLQNDLKLCSAAVQSREGDISNLENEIAMLRNKNANSDAQLSKANDEIAILRRERLQEVEKSKHLEDELNKLSAATQKDRSTLESHIKLIEEKLVRAEADLVGEQAKSKTLAVTITKLESDQANYEDESNRRNEAFEKLETEITERDAKIGQLVKTTDELTKDRDHYKNESDYFRSQEDKAIVLEDKLLVERKAHEEQVARLKKEIEEVMAQKVPEELQPDIEAVSSDEDDDSSEKDTKRERAGSMVFSMPLPSIEEQFEACAKQRPDLLKALALAHFPDFFRSADQKDAKSSGDEQDVKGVKRQESKQADADGKDVKYASVNCGLSGFDSEDERERKRFGHTKAPTNPFNSPSVATNTDLKATDIKKLELKATEANRLKEEVAEMSKLKQTMTDLDEDERKTIGLDGPKQNVTEMEKVKQTVPDMDGLVHIKSTSVARFMNLKYLTETSPLTQLAFWAVMALLTLSCLAAWLCGADYYHLTQARQMLNYANALTYEYTQEVLENPTLQYPLDFGKVIYDWFAWWPYNHSGFILRYVDLDFTTVG